MKGTYTLEVEEGITIEAEYTYVPGSPSGDYDVPDETPELYLENIILITDRRRTGVDLENLQYACDKETIYKEIWESIHR